MEESPETKMIEKLKQSSNHIEKLIGSNIERISEIEKDNTISELLHTVEKLSELIDEFTKIQTDILERLAKVETLALATNELVHLNKKLSEAKNEKS